MRREPQASLTRLCSCGKFISDVWAKDRGCLVQRSVMFGPKISTLCKEGEKGIVPKCTKTCSERFGECPLFSIHWAQGLNPLKRLPPSIDGHASIHRRGHLYPWARRRLSMAEHVPMDGAHGDTPRMIPGLQGGTAVRPQPRLPACNGRDRCRHRQENRKRGVGRTIEDAMNAPEAPTEAPRPHSVRMDGHESAPN